MIKRINFIEKKAFTFTYQKLVQICAVIVLINVMASGFQVYRSYSAKKDIAEKTQTLKKLDVQKEMLLKKPIKQRVNVGEHQELVDKIESATKWSVLLNEIAYNLPNTVWITDFKSETKQLAAVKPAEDKAKKKAAKKADKAKKPKKDEPMVYVSHLEISGLGRDMTNITEFAKNLAKSNFFKNPTLSESSKQDFGIAFTIKSEIDEDDQ